MMKRVLIFAGIFAVAALLATAGKFRFKQHVSTDWKHFAPVSDDRVSLTWKLKVNGMGFDTKARAETGFLALEHQEATLSFIPTPNRLMALAETRSHRWMKTSTSSSSAGLYYRIDPETGNLFVDDDATKSGDGSSTTAAGIARISGGLGKGQTAVIRVSTAAAFGKDVKGTIHESGFSVESRKRDCSLAETQTYTLETYQ